MMNPYKRHPLRLKKSKKRGGIFNIPLGALKRARQYRDDFADLLAPRKRSRLGFAPRLGSLTGVMTARTREGTQFEEGANSLSKCNYGRLPSYVPQSVLRTLAKQLKVYNTSNNSVSTVGKQAVVYFAYSSPSDLYGGLASVNDKMIFHGVEAEISMVNASSTNSQIMIYDVICRKDCNSGNTGSPNGAWQVGIDDAGGNNTDYQIVGSIPTESRLFTDYYKIVQRTRVSLGPGQLHRHEVSWHPNKVLSGEYLNNCTYGLQGVTVGTMIVHYGMPAHDSTTTTAVTVDVSSLDIIVKYSQDWRLLEDSVTSWSKNNTLATSFAVGEQFVNEAVGQVQDSGGLHPGTLHS